MWLFFPLNVSSYLVWCCLHTQGIMTSHNEILHTRLSVLNIMVHLCKMLLMKDLYMYMIFFHGGSKLVISICFFFNLIQVYIPMLGLSILYMWIFSGVWRNVLAYYYNINYGMYIFTSLYLPLCNDFVNRFYETYITVGVGRL